MVVGFNEETKEFNGWMPDLMILSHGITHEEMVKDAQVIMTEFFKIAKEHDTEIPVATPVEVLQIKWTKADGYTVIPFELELEEG